MQLRIIEIEAIKKKILDEITSKIIIPNFSEELSKYKTDLIEIEKIDNEILKLSEDKLKLTSKYKFFNSYVKINDNETYIESKLRQYKQNLESEYMNKMLPSALNIQNDIILSSNKDLSELVKELISKYSK